MWFIFFASIATISLCVLIHYEMLYRLSRISRWLKIRGRYHVTMSVLTAIAAHTVETWLFGVGYYLITDFDGLNQLVDAQGNIVTGFFNCLYFSFATYTSLGYGDIVPEGPIQFMAGTEALVGLVFIGWSASFLYLEMQKHWKNID